MLSAASRTSGYASRRWFGEIVVAFERAAHDDPLFAHPLGPAATAAILVALAGYRTGLRREGRGRGYGLFDIMIPPNAKEGGILGTSHGSAYVAIDQLRRSFESCVAFSWPERLAGFFFANEPHGPKQITLEHRFASSAVMATAAQLLREFVPEAATFVDRDRLPLLAEKAA